MATLLPVIRALNYNFNEIGFNSVEFFSFLGIEASDSANIISLVKISDEFSWFTVG